jgi:hypothetical protein
VSQLAVRPVGLAPLIEQGQNLSGLLRQQPVHRCAAWDLVGELAAGPAGDPAVRANLTELQHPSSRADRPPAVESVIEQVQQAGLGGRVHPVRDPATQPQPPFPSTSVSLIANSLQASDSRATSAFAASNS